MAKESNFLEYEWELEGQRAHFLVNMAAEKSAPDPALPILAYVNCAPRDAARLELTPAERRRIESIARRIERKLKLPFVGSIALLEQEQIYFYAPDMDAFEALETLAARERRLLLTANLAKEPGWNTYFGLLYPDAAKYQSVLNRETVAKLYKTGDKVDAARRVNFMTYFPSEQLRIQFSEEARLSGFAVGQPRFAPERELAYGVALHKITSLLPEQIDRATTQVIRMASRYEGELDGWDCPLISRNHPFR